MRKVIFGDCNFGYIATVDSMKILPPCHSIHKPTEETSVSAIYS